MSQSQQDSLSPLPCAWCFAEQHRELGNGSHGICTDHANRSRAAHRTRLEQRLLMYYHRLKRW
jgi:hypothetical protein